MLPPPQNSLHSKPSLHSTSRATSNTRNTDRNAGVHKGGKTITKKLAHTNINTSKTNQSSQDLRYTPISISDDATQDQTRRHRSAHDHAHTQFVESTNDRAMRTSNKHTNSNASSTNTTTTIFLFS